MLQIYIYGPSESGFLDLDPGTILEMEADADILDEDFSLSEFSLPGFAPWTENNRRLLGFAERFKNFNTTDVFFKASVYDSGFPEIPAAKLTLIGKEGNFAYTKGKFSFVVTGTKGLFGRQVKNKKLADLTLGGKIAWDTLDSRQFAESFMKGNFPQWNHFSFVPVAIENFFDTGRPDYDGEFLAQDTVNTVILTGSGQDAWTFGRPKAADPSTPATSGTAEYVDYRTIPFLKTKYILRAIFEENGYTVTGEFLERSEYNDLVTFNNFSIENYSPGYVDYNRSFNPANHVPDQTIVEYLKGIFSFFSMYPVFSGDNQVRLVIRKNIRKEKTIFSINDICDELFDTAQEDQGTGYTINYNFEGDDYAGERIKDLKDKTLVGTVPVATALSSIVLPRQLTTDDIALVTAENMYYQVADATSNPVKWEVYAERMDPFIVGDGERAVDIHMSPLCTYAELQEDIGLFVRRNYVGARMPGSYMSKGQQVKANCPNKIFFAGRRINSSLVVAPVSSNHDRDINNTIVFPFSLALQGGSGMGINYHEEWQNIRQGDQLTKTTLQTDRRVIIELGKNNFVEKNGVLFIVSKKEQSIPLDSTMEVTLLLV